MPQPEDSTQPADQHSIPNILNKYFTQVGPKLASAILSPAGYVTHSTPSAPNSLYLTPVLHNDVVNQINNLKCSKSNDSYDIPVSLVKMVENIISICLADLYNSSISNGVFPEKLKAKVVPLFKSGSRLNPSNYKPISLLSHFSKMFEKLLYINTNNFFDQKHVICPEQMVFVVFIQLPYHC